ncbi:glycoside hydrolase [Burkholderiaceae bacterium 16]|nr:glycoside hydrolase [Burkholderiaceae bacterium 16]
MSVRDFAPEQRGLPAMPGVAVKGVPLSGQWAWLETSAGAAGCPAALPEGAGWLAAPVPGTVAGALRAAGRWDDAAPPPLHQRDHWYRVHFTGSGRRVLRFSGLATLAEVWLNGALVLTTRHMFVSHQIEVELAGENTLHLCFRAMYPWLRAQRGAVRWKPRMIAPATLRAVRTTLLGHMAGWCPPVHAVGPWRPVELLDPASDDASQGMRADLSSRIEGHEGVVSLRLHFPGEAPEHGSFSAVDGDGEPLCAGQLRRVDAHTLAGALRIAHARLWWPHTHGEPYLYRIDATLQGGTLACGRIGFRTIEADRGAAPGAFALRINGERLFCRGACVSSHDLHGLSDAQETVGRWLALARGASMNMVRVSGVTCYPGENFYRLCDELGLLVWQDFMFANFDYGSSDGMAGSALMDDAACEVTEWLVSTRAHPSVAVLCGGSETEQQAAMLGAARTAWRQPLFEALIPGLVAAHRPDVVYVRNSPCEGAWPFQPDTGVSHYYGVGAYQRPLTDARLANVRFATECLAFANVPCQRTLAEHDLGQPLHDPRWKARVPRDAGAPWDFEDVRDFYLRTLYDVDPPHLRYERPARYLALSRAVVAEIMTDVFSEWRRVGSNCAGGLVWQLQDLLPGPGWGIVDACARPKSAWHALRQVWQPLQLLFTDEGLNGLHLHLLNESPEPHQVRLSLRCYRDGETVVAEATQDLVLAPREAHRIEAASLMDVFFDFTYAYRFGPPAHDVVVASLEAADGALLSQVAYLPDRRASALKPPGLKVVVERVAGEWWLTISTQRFARWVHIEDHVFQPAQDWFHLAPGESRRIRLMHEGGSHALGALIPSGEIHAINADRPVSYNA